MTNSMTSPHDSKSAIPEGISEEAWEAALALTEALGLQYSAQPHHFTIARAFMAATLAERDEIAADADRWAERYHAGAEATGAISAQVIAGGFHDFADAIRKRGEVNTARKNSEA